MYNEFETIIIKSIDSITVEMLDDWAYNWEKINETPRSFIDACKKANKLVGFTGDDEMSEFYYDWEKEHYPSLVEIYYSHYNGDRVIAAFKNINDAIKWEINGCGYINEEDGLFWCEQPAYI